jgi:hypothetical protein
LEGNYWQHLDDFIVENCSVRLQKRLYCVWCFDKENLIRRGRDGSLIDKLLCVGGFGKKTLIELRQLFMILGTELKEPGRYKTHIYTPPRTRKLDREEDIYKMRKGGAKFKEIAEKYGISTGRAHQVFKTACRRLGKV